MALNVVAKSPRRLMAQSTRKGTGGKERNIYTYDKMCGIYGRQGVKDKPDIYCQTSKSVDL